MANARHSFDRPIPDFQLGYNHRSTLKRTTRIRNHYRINYIICGLCDRDQIFARHAVDQNESDPTRDIPDTLKIVDIDSLFQKPISCCATKCICSVSPEKRDMPPCPRCRHRLVGALAAAEHLELSSKNCFSRFW